MRDAFQVSNHNPGELCCHLKLDRDIKPTYHPVHIVVIALYLTQPKKQARLSHAQSSDL